MKFCEKLKEARIKAGLKQEELAEALGVSLRTISNYESGERYPKKREVYYKLAELFHTEENFFLNEGEEFMLAAAKEYGAKGAKQARALVEEVSGLFSGGGLARRGLGRDDERYSGSLLDCKGKEQEVHAKKYRKEQPEE